MKYWHDQMKEHYYETNFGYVKDIRHLGEKKLAFWFLKDVILGKNQQN